MKRTTILNAIEHELRESLAESGQIRPLSEIVARVASQIRVEESFAMTSRVIPVEQIAAFVDGELTSEETQAICKAVKTDNSILAELIAAVRALKEQSELDSIPIGTDLQDRLAAMAPPPAPPLANTPLANAPAAGAPLSSAPVSSASVSSAPAEGAPHASATKPTSVTPDEIESNRLATRSFVVAVLAVAAGVVSLVFWMREDKPLQPDGTPLVERKSDPADVVIPPPSAPSNHLVDPDSEEFVESVPVPEEVAPSMENGYKPNKTAIARESNESSESALPVEDSESATVDVMPRDSEPVVVDIDRTRRLADFRWTEISGLLTQQNPMGDSSSDDNAVPTWKGISVSSQENQFPESADRLVMRTMPMSRAQANLSGGGKLVIASDTAMSMRRSSKTVSADIQLLHGSLAAVDLPPGTLIQFTLSGRPMIRLRWESEATALVERTGQTLSIYVHQGAIKLDGRLVKKAAYSIRADEPMREIAAPKRLATWVSRPVETISVARPVLAQIAESDNVLRSLNDRVMNLSKNKRLTSSDQRQLTTLARWQASMAGINLYRLAGSRVPALRYAAIERLVELPQTDPRSTRVWNTFRQSVQNPQRVAQIKRWCTTVAGGARPTSTEIETIAVGLGADEVAFRALCDYLLRKSFGGGPVFDPTWTGTAQLRGINLWRQKLGLRPLPRTGVNQPAAARGNR